MGCVCVAFTYRSTSVRVEEFSRTHTLCGWTTENENGRRGKRNFHLKRSNFSERKRPARLLKVCVLRMIDERGMKIKLKVITDTHS